MKILEFVCNTLMIYVDVGIAAVIKALAAPNIRPFNH